MAKRAAKATKKTPRPSSPPLRRSTRNVGTVDAERRTKDRAATEFIARGLWVHGSRVLLCRSVAKGYFYLPGGHIEFGESAAAAMEREFAEETGVRVVAGRLLLVSEGAFQTKKRGHHELNLVFACGSKGEAVGGGPGFQNGRGLIAEPPLWKAVPPKVRSREKGIAFEWVDLAAAVDLDIRPLAVKAWLVAGPGPGTEWVSEIALPA